jgi:ParB family chromosome partitioning protein
MTNANASNSNKKRLGRGLAALIGDEAPEEVSTNFTANSRTDAMGLKSVPIAFIQNSPNNPRKIFDENELTDLSNSIREKGLLQPIVIRPIGPDQYELVAGERRWRAAQKANLHEIPALIRELTDGEALEIALIENIQRSDLNPIEEALAYSQLMNAFSYTQQQLAESLGKSRSHIANTIRLLNLPLEVKQKIESGEITAGHARALITAESPDELAKKIIALGLSVRDVENLTRQKQSSNEKAEEKDSNIKMLERQLTEILGLKVEIKDKGLKGGSLIISYKNADQLDTACRKLGAD